MAFFVQCVEGACRLAIGGNLDCELLVQELYGADNRQKRAKRWKQGVFATS